MTRECRRWIVTGRVQGVSFRAATRAFARRVGLSGFARNRADGSVEVIACGAGAELDRLAEFLASGPPHARVDSLQSSLCEPQSFTDFQVR
jgi:acylphosphatase